MRDLDVAHESVELAKHQIRLQANNQVLKQTRDNSIQVGELLSVDLHPTKLALKRYLTCFPIKFFANRFPNFFSDEI